MQYKRIAIGNEDPARHSLAVLFLDGNPLFVEGLTHSGGITTGAVINGAWDLKIHDGVVHSNGKPVCKVKEMIEVALPGKKFGYNEYEEAIEWAEARLTPVAQ